VGQGAAKPISGVGMELQPTLHSIGDEEADKTKIGGCPLCGGMVTVL